MLLLPSLPPVSGGRSSQSAKSFFKNVIEHIKP
jgi:hypothetical protein